MNKATAEHQRLAEAEARQADWKLWGPYVSDRAWGTVREDYSPHGTAWDYFPHDQARSRAYRWNEDGLGGLCNRFQNICLAAALWNEQDPILKERLFGLSGPEGNHGEDVKEYYFYLDNTPTHSYLKMLYKYPQVAYPYAQLVAENQRRGREQDEFELDDALGQSLAESRYFDVFIEYAKVDPEDILCRITAINRGPDPAPLHLLPHLWFRNTWSWGYDRAKPWIERLDSAPTGVAAAHAWDHHLGDRYWYVRTEDETAPALLFTENDSNVTRLWGGSNPTPYVKDAFHEALIQGHWEKVNPAQKGTKAAAHIRATLLPGQALTVSLRFTPQLQADPFANFEAIFAQRQQEADAFYAAIHPNQLSEEDRAIQRQALAGLLWSKQFYHYGVRLWLDGDPATPAPPQTRQRGRNADWTHLYNLDVISMPDKWEYPWYAAWDLAFHALPLALVDPEWAKRQLVLMVREWYMHPNGQIPAYEWAFGDVNPPVHAWAAWRVYKITRNLSGQADTVFLERVFQKLLLNFTWWVNRKDAEGKNIFQGGFLGLDNIGVFDRSAALPTGGHLEQADGTAWMGMYCLNMLAIALELARTLPAYEDMATKFFEHFVYIAHAMNSQHGLWNEEDGFYYDELHLPNGWTIPLRLRSFVGLIPLFAVETLEADLLEKLPRFRERMNWFIRYRPQLVQPIAALMEPGQSDRRLLSLVSQTQLQRVAQRMFDPAQFLSPYGLRALSKEYEHQPFLFSVNGETHQVGYEPAESRSGLFGGNSNWRGPIWFPVNYLMLESLQKYHHYYGENLQVEMPVGSGVKMDLSAAANQLAQRLINLFRCHPVTGQRPFNGENRLFQTDPHWRDYLLFHEYFHGDNGRGVGASHQTGWTALVAKLLQQSYSQ